MKDIIRVDIEVLFQMAQDIIFYKTEPSFIIDKLGVVYQDNGYGTVFLKPENPNLKFVWLTIKDGLIVSIGLGGEIFDLTLQDLVTFSSSYRENYNRYDEQYDYIFVFLNRSCGIKISSKNKLFENSIMIENIDIKSVTLLF